MLAARPRRRGGVAAAFAQKLEQRAAGKADEAADATSSAPRVVPCTRHEERDVGHLPCILSSTLRGVFSPNALLRVSSKKQPELRIFARVHSDRFTDNVRGISILRTIAEAANLSDRDVELVQVSEEAATLRRVEMVLFDRYLSKRDLWHLHLTMMQDMGDVVYANYNQNFRNHIPKSAVVEMIAADNGEAVLSGRVRSRSTEVVFRTGSANFVVLIQLSAELFDFSLSGRPYWELLLDSFGQLIDKSLRVDGATTVGGHYIRIILFSRLHASAAGSIYKDRDDNTITDRYEVFWEGSAKAMPPTQQILASLRRLCMDLHEGRTPSAGPCTRSSGWRGISGVDLVEASQGNLLECLNLVLDHFDQHHMDRSLMITGQTVVVLTAGNGLIRPKTRKLYKLTDLRLTTAGPSSSKACYMICVRQPPCHKVPWVQWPGGPAPGKSAEKKADDLSSCPSWLDLTFHNEVTFCQFGQETQFVSASLLPLRSLASTSASTYVPCMGEEDRAPKTPTATQRRGSVVGLGGSSPKHTGAELWKELRAPELRPYFKWVPKKNEHRLRKSASNAQMYQQNYSVQPTRFHYTSFEAETKNMMADLIGCRLEARTSELLYRESDQLSTFEPARRQVSKRTSQSTANLEAEDYLQSQLLPSELTSCLISASNGRREWKLEAQDRCIEVWYRDHYARDSVADASSFQQEIAASITVKESFLIRRHCTVQEREDETDTTMWQICTRIFHLPPPPSWNKLDFILAGDFRMPPALPYPANTSGDAISDECPGWQLRSAIKQHLYVLVPDDPEQNAHEHILEYTLRALNGSIGTGVDPFQVVEKELAKTNKELPSNAGSEETLKRFEALMHSLEDLCWRDGKEKMGVSLVSGGKRFTVKRENRTVYVKDMKIASAHAHSRDWFELFYDSQYSPPRPFVLVLQWMVCSSVHLVNFTNSLKRLVEDKKFSLIRAPLGQLFPQPAPHCVWSSVHETNFERLAFYAPRKISLQKNMDDERRKRMNAVLLQHWLQTPCAFFFLFSTSHMDFKIDAIQDVTDEYISPEESSLLDHRHQKIFQRLKGWTLCSKDGTCLVALREDHILFYENRCKVFDVRNAEASLEGLEAVRKLWQIFVERTEQAVEACGLKLHRGSDLSTIAQDKLSVVDPGS